MRIIDQRYERDLRRFELARRFITYEVRTQIIIRWTGLSEERIRNLCRSYAPESAAHRHRGPSPRRLTGFLRTPQARTESAALAALCLLLEVVPLQATTPKALPSVERGERLCRAFEAFRRLVPASRFSLEHAIALLQALAQHQELTTGLCQHCRALILIDRGSLQARVCDHCTRTVPGVRDLGDARLTQAAVSYVSTPLQADLFWP